MLCSLNQNGWESFDPCSQLCPHRYDRRRGTNRQPRDHLFSYMFLFDSLLLGIDMIRFSFRGLIRLGTVEFMWIIWLSFESMRM